MQSIRLVTLLAVLIGGISILRSAAAHPGSGIAVDAQGRVFFTDTGKGVWRVDKEGQLTLISPSAMHWMAIDREGKFGNAEDEFGEWFGRLTPRGDKPTLISCSDFPCVIGKDGNLYYAKMHGLTIVRRTPHGQETVFVAREKFGIGADRPVGVNGMACGSDGLLYLISLDSANKLEGSGEHVLYAVGMDGSIRPVAKNFVQDLLPESERHPEVRPQYCRGMAVDGQGNVFVAVTGNRCVMKVTRNGETSVVLRTAKPWTPTGVDVFQGDLYVLEYDDETPTEGRNWPPRVRKRDQQGNVATIAIVRGNGAVRTPQKPRELVLQAPPATSVDSVAVSPDGSLVATAAGEGGVRLYDARTGALVRTIGAVGDRGVSFSPDGRTLSAAGFHMDKLVGVFDVRTGNRVLTLPGHTEWEAYAATISPDGKLLASTGADKQILVWELSTGKLLHQIKDQIFPTSALAFSPNSATLASGGGDKLVRLWDCSTGELRQSLAGHGQWICSLAFSPDGKSLASGACDWGFHRGHDWPRAGGSDKEPCEWKLWDIASGKLLRSADERGRMLSLAFAPGGKSLACSIGKDLRLYDLSAESTGRVVARHDATITSVGFTPDGASVVTGSHDQTVKRTSLASGKTEWQSPGYFEQVNSVALSRDAALLVTGSSDHRFARGKLQAGAREIGPGAVRLWDAKTGHMLRRLGEAAEQIMAVAISADGKSIAAGGARNDGKGVARVWDAATGKQLCVQTDHAAEVLAVAFAPDGASFAAAAGDGLVKIRDSQTGSILRTLPDHEGGATSVAFTPDGKTLVGGQAKGGARLWDVQTGKLLHTCQTAGPKATSSLTIDRLMNSIGVSRDGEILATCASSVNNEFVEPVRIWDVRSGALVRDFATENIHGRPMALSPDGSILATGGKSVQLWDVRTGKKLRKLIGHLKRTQSITFSADGRLLVAGGSYGTTNAWEVASGKHLVTLFAFSETRNGTVADDWLAHHPDGYYNGSQGSERFLAWRVGDELKTTGSPSDQFHRPERIEAALRLVDKH